MSTMTSEHGIRELTVDELDAVAGGEGLVQAIGQVLNGVVHAAVNGLSDLIASKQNIVRC